MTDFRTVRHDCKLGPLIGRNANKERVAGPLGPSSGTPIAAKFPVMDMNGRTLPSRVITTRRRGRLPTVAANIFMEDDASDGADHVDAHRSIAFEISKYSPSSA